MIRGTMIALLLFAAPAFFSCTDSNSNSRVQPPARESSDPLVIRVVEIGVPGVT
jgi:hypothetical protein